MISDFIDDGLEDASLAAFIDHLNTCENCREELSIQFLIEKGFEKLDTGGTINLNRDMKEYIELETKRLKSRRRLRRTAVRMELLSVSAFAAVCAAAITYGIIKLL